MDDIDNIPTEPATSIPDKKMYKVHPLVSIVLLVITTWSSYQVGKSCHNDNNNIETSSTCRMAMERLWNSDGTTVADNDGSVCRSTTTTTLTKSNIDNGSCQAGLGSNNSVDVHYGDDNDDNDNNNQTTIQFEIYDHDDGSTTATKTTTTTTTMVSPISTSTGRQHRPTGSRNEIYINAKGMNCTMISSTQNVQRLMESIARALQNDDEDDEDDDDEDDDEDTVMKENDFEDDDDNDEDDDDDDDITDTNLLGYYTYESKSNNIKGNVIHSLALLMDGAGTISLTAWPHKGVVMLNVFIIDDDNEDDEEKEEEENNNNNNSSPSSDDDDDEDDEDDDDDEDEDEDEEKKENEENEENDQEEDLINLSVPTEFARINRIAHALFPQSGNDNNDNDDDSSSSSSIKHPLLQLNVTTDIHSRSTHASDPSPIIMWAMVSRGFMLSFNDLDKHSDIAEIGEFNEHIVSVQTKFQRIDIIDRKEDEDLAMLEYYKNSPGDSEYFEQNPHYEQPERVLYLDGVIQSTKYGIATYHEALVQPGLFTHPNPKRVAIIGGGECATLREVLKHATLEKVVMVEIDPGIVEASRKYLPEWNDCSMLSGRADVCMDDPKAEIVFSDAMAWFMERFGNDSIMDVPEEEKFDVVIMDALDPQHAVEIVKHLYGDKNFLTSLYNSLKSSGILVAQVGESVDTMDHSESSAGNLHWQRHVFSEGLLDNGFSSLLEYSVEHAEFESWSFFVAFRNIETAPRWWMNAAQFNLEIRKRSVRTVPGKEDFLITLDDLPFVYFDGNQMEQYQLVSRPKDIVYCRREPLPSSCIEHVFDPNIPNYGRENFHFVDADDGSKEIHATNSIPSESYLCLDDLVRRVQVPSTSLQLINQLQGRSKINAVKAYLELFGCRTLGEVDMTQAVTGYPSFMSHNRRCSRKDLQEDTSRYDPSLIRHAESMRIVADRTIAAGERI